MIIDFVEMYPFNIYNESCYTRCITETQKNAQALHLQFTLILLFETCVYIIKLADLINIVSLRSSF